MEFDDIYGWEARNLNQNEWWYPLPDHIRERTRFYNIPVNETPCEMTTQGVFAEKGSFLHMLPHAAKPEDFVVVKTPGLQSALCFSCFQDWPPPPFCHAQAVFILRFLSGRLQPRNPKTENPKP